MDKPVKFAAKYYGSGKFNSTQSLPYPAFSLQNRIEIRLESVPSELDIDKWYDLVIVDSDESDGAVSPLVSFNVTCSLANKEEGARKFDAEFSNNEGLLGFRFTSNKPYSFEVGETYKLKIFEQIKKE